MEKAANRWFLPGLLLALVANGACTSPNKDFDVLLTDVRPPGDGPRADPSDAGIPDARDAAAAADTTTLDVAAEDMAGDPVDGGQDVSGPLPPDAGSDLTLDLPGELPPPDLASDLPADLPPDMPADTATDMPPDTAPDVSPPPNGLRGEYFAGDNHEMFLLERVDPNLNFNWGHDSPVPGTVPEEHFSVRWTGKIQPRYTETYTFHLAVDDGARLAINDVFLIDNWSKPAGELTVQLPMVADQLYDIRVEYFDKVLTAVCRFYWSSPTQAKEIVPFSRLYTR